MAAKNGKALPQFEDFLAQLRTAMQPTITIPEPVAKADPVQAVLPQARRANRELTTLRGLAADDQDKAQTLHDAIAACVLFRQGKTISRASVHPDVERALIGGVIARIEGDRLVPLAGWQDRQKEPVLFPRSRRLRAKIEDQPVVLAQLAHCVECDVYTVCDVDSGRCAACEPAPELAHDWIIHETV